MDINKCWQLHVNENCPAWHALTLTDTIEIVHYLSLFEKNKNLIKVPINIIASYIISISIFEWPDVNKIKYTNPKVYFLIYFTSNQKYKYVEGRLLTIMSSHCLDQNVKDELFEILKPWVKENVVQCANCLQYGGDLCDSIQECPNIWIHSKCQVNVDKNECCLIQ